MRGCAHKGIRIDNAAGRRAAFAALLLLIAQIAALPDSAAESPEPTSSIGELKKLSLEELVNVPVTSVSKTEETLKGAAAAIAVVTNEDIRRSGVTTIPEALRFVPGIHVARRNANSWAVSSRGFSSVNSEKLLVLTDTRSIYTPLFSGVFWDVQDHVLEDIERIEVIRGPGAALWGSNAVNGVINIKTKSASQTQGLYLEAGTGTEEQANAAARYGATTGGGMAYRVFGKYSDRDASFHTDPTRSDDWHLGHFGFRTDWNTTESDVVTVQGDFYSGKVGQLAPSANVIGRPGPTGDLEIAVRGGNVLGLWRRTLHQHSDVQLRAYYDSTHRNDPSFVDNLETLDLDFQHLFAPGSRHELIWGLNYRLLSNTNDGKGVFAVAPTSSDDQLVSGFVQDQITITDALHLTVGTKLEHNDFSGFEVQPSIRAAWNPSGRHTLWSAVSRAVRVPTRLERDISIDVTDPAGNPVIRLLGNEDFESEVLVAYELGHRWQPAEQVFIDLAAFHNRYDRLASLELGTPFVDASGRTIVPIVNRNLTDGVAQGFEALVSCSPFANWRLTASYSYIDLDVTPQGQDLNRGSFLEDSTPRHQFGLRSFIDLPAGLQFDAQFRHIDAVRRIPEIVTGEGVPGYSELDVRLSWRGWRQTEIAVIGRNLLHDQHAEFGAPAARGEIERSVYGSIAWRF